jgi:hypothetical protein
MQHPMVWMAGVYLGLIILVTFAAASFFGVFTGTQIGFCLFLLAPLTVGGVLGMLRYDDYSPILFLMQAKKHYFGIVIPAILCALVVAVTMSLLLVPLSLILGDIDQIMVSTLCGVCIPVFFAAMFYPSVIVFEGATVTRSMLRSVTLVIYDTITALKFWVVTMLLLFLSFFGISMAWAGLTYDHIEEFTNLSLAEYANLSIGEQQAIFSTFTIEDWMAMLGDRVLFLVVCISVCAAIVTTFLLCYLCVCYTEAKKAIPAASLLENEKIR